jgi:hypothetical protein
MSVAFLARETKRSQRLAPVLIAAASPPTMKMGAGFREHLEQTKASFSNRVILAGKHKGWQDP